MTQAQIANQQEYAVYEGVGAWPAPANDNVAAMPATHPYVWDGESGQRVPLYQHRGRKRLVIVESPYNGDVERNVAYARACVRDSLMRGESPIASHLLYTQPGILDDDLPEERILGIDAGLAWRVVADASVVYTDFGMSAGMRYGVQKMRDAGKAVEYRTLGWVG